MVLSKRSQITIFIIVALVLVAGIITFFVLKDKIIFQSIPKDIRPVEDYYLSCVRDATEMGVQVLETQGGWIYNPEFEPGSTQNPFSSQLNFQGIPVPYWYYTSGNGLIKEQVPGKSEMEKQLGRFISENIANCDFSSYREKGFSVKAGKAATDVKINENSVDVSVSSPLQVVFQEQTASINTHKISYQSKLGKFYSEALTIYNSEKSDMFLENYAVDVLRLYAPVDGIVIDCAPKTWTLQKISDDLKSALEANIASIKIGTGKDYFTQNLNIDNNARFVFFKNWPSRIEVWPAENGILIAQPVGLQAGMAALGFCYVPYHFVYDVYFPVLVQIGDNNEVFQFPVSIIVDKNLPRNSLGATLESAAEPEICSRANTLLKVYTYDSNSEPVKAKVSVQCLDESCVLGESKIVGGESFVEANAPQCANAIVSAEAEGYVSDMQIVSTVNPTSVNILLNKKYPQNVSLIVDNKEITDMAVVNFVSEKDSVSLVWPQQKSISLIEGDYNITGFIYKNNSINLPESSQRQCVNIAKQGLLGMFGATQEKCFDIKTPGQTISNVISGGGSTEQYITEFELKKGNIKIQLESITIPKTLEDLQTSYSQLEDKNAYVEFY